MKNLHRPRIQVEQEIIQTSPPFYPDRNGTINHHYETTDGSDANSEMPISSPSSLFHGFASHTSPPLSSKQYSQSHPKNLEKLRNQRSKESSNVPTSYSNPHSQQYQFSTNQPGAPIVYTQVHSELGAVRPKTAKKISNAASLNDFNRQQPERGNVVFDLPRGKRTSEI